MYLYYDKTRTLKTVISHGEPIRQNSDVNIFICLDRDFFELLNFNEEAILSSRIIANVAYENEKDGGRGIVSSNPELLKFEKNNPSEMTYYLQSNKEYWTYHLNLKNNEFTVFPGSVFLTLELDSKEWSFTLSDAELYVEPRKGLPEYDNSIKIKQYNKIIERIERIEKFLK